MKGLGSLWVTTKKLHKVCDNLHEAPNWAKAIPHFQTNTDLKTFSFGVEHSYTAYIREYPIADDW